MNEPKSEDVMRAMAWYEVVGKNIGSVTVPYNEIQAIANLLREKDALIKHLDEDRLGWADEAVKVKMQLNEKDAEIERLKTEVNLYENTCGKLIVRDNGEVVGFIDGQEKTYISKNIARVLRSMAVTTARDKVIDEIKVRFSMHFGTYTAKSRTSVKDLFLFIDQIAEEMKEETNGTEA